MASRTVTDSVARATDRPNQLDQLEAQLQALSDRFPDAHFLRYRDNIPSVADDCFVAPGAFVIGDVTLEDSASVWFGCVLRGDVNQIHVGPRSNLQDGTVVHLGDLDPTLVGADVVVGHRAVLHGCRVDDRCLIGIQATLLDGCHIGEGSVVGAGSVVPAGKVFPPNSLLLGTPARLVRTLEPESASQHAALAAKYCRLHHNYRHG